MRSRRRSDYGGAAIAAVAGAAGLGLLYVVISLFGSILGYSIPQGDDLSFERSHWKWLPLGHSEYTISLSAYKMSGYYTDRGHFPVHFVHKHPIIVHLADDHPYWSDPGGDPAKKPIPENRPIGPAHLGSWLYDAFTVGAENPLPPDKDGKRIEQKVRVYITRK